MSYQFSASLGYLTTLLFVLLVCQPAGAVISYSDDEVIVTIDDWQVSVPQQDIDFTNALLEPDYYNWGPISHGFSMVILGETWLRLDVDFNVVPEDTPFLYIPNAYLDNIKSVVIHNGQVISRMDIGSDVPLTDKLFPNPFISMPIAISTPGRYSILISLDTLQITQLVPYAVLIPEKSLLLDKLPQKSSRASGVIGSIFAYTFLMGLLLIYRFQSKMLHALIFSLSALLAVFCREGLLFQSTGLNQIWWYQQFVISMVLVCIAMALLYIQDELRQKITNKWFHRTLLVTAICIVSFAGINFFESLFFIPVLGPVSYVLIVFSLLLLIISLLYVVFVDKWRTKLMAVIWLAFISLTLMRFLTSFFPSIYLTDMIWWGIAATAVSAWVCTDYLWRIARNEIQRESLRSASESRIDLVNRLSHELRTPLNAVIGLADILETNKDPQVARNYAKMIHKSGQNLLGLVNDILDFSKAEKGQIELACEPIRLDKLLIEVHSGFLQQVLNAGVLPISYIDPSTPFFLRGDALRIQQVLNNLISNALKFSSKGGTIELKVAAGQRVGTSIELIWQLKDDGRGIPLNLQGRIFEPYQQAQVGDDTQLNGTGLGLAITRQLVEQMGGQIRVESKPGQGACFFFNTFLEIDKQVPDIDTLFTPLADKKIVFVSRLKSIRREFCANLGRWGPDIVEADSLDEDIAAVQSCDILIIDTVRTLNPEDVDRINDLPRQVKLVIMVMETPSWLERITDRQIRLLQLPAAVLDVVVTVVELLSGSKIVIEGPSNSERVIDVSDHHVLSVDDNMVNLTVAKKLLQSIGVDSVSMHGGGSALEILYKQHEAFSLVLLDCEMPGIDGFETCRRLRAFEARENLKPLPVIALTAHALSEIKTRCEQAGMNETLYKPVDRDTLLRLLARYSLGNT